MTEQDQTTQQVGESQSTTTRRSVLSSVGAGLAALGVGVGSIDSVQAAGQSPLPVDSSEWSSSGDDTHSVSSTGSGITLSYDSDNYYGDWTYETTAKASGDVTIDWTYDGHHSWYYADAEAKISVNGNETQLVDPYTNVDGDFTKSGQATLSVSEGDSITVEIEGSHWDYSQILKGDLTLTPQSDSGATSAPIEALDANNIRYQNNGGPFSVQIGEVSPADSTAYLTADVDGTEVLSTTVGNWERVHGESSPPVNVMNGADITLTTYASESQNTQLDQQTHTVEWGSYVNFGEPVAEINALDADDIRYQNIGGPFSVEIGNIDLANDTAYLTVDIEGTEVLSQEVNENSTVEGEAYPPKNVFNGDEVTLTTYKSSAQDTVVDQETHTVEWGSYVEF